MGKKHVDIELKRLYATEALKWCKKNMGINKRKRNTPTVYVRIRLEEDDKIKKIVEGSYFSKSNRIVVYGLNCNTLEDVVSTVIHEYTHYLQSMKKYWEYFQTYYYSQHPYERQAKRNEEKYTKQCYNHIRRLIY